MFNKDLIHGFKSFILRGNVVDLAVGVVIGAAFGKVIDALVKSLLTPLLAIIVRTPDFSDLSIKVGDNVVGYGIVINEVISFLLVAAAVFFFIVVPMNKFMAKVKKEEPKGEPTTKSCDFCINEIHIGATRCPFCTAQLN